MGKKFGAKTKMLNKVKQNTSKMGAKKQKFVKGKQTPISPKMSRNSSFDSKKGKNSKVRFANDSTGMRTPIQRKPIGTPNSSFKGSANSKKSLVSNRKPTPFPHASKIKQKKIESEEEEGSDELEVDESDVSFESEDDISDESLDDSGFMIESAEEEIEEEEEPPVEVKKSTKPAKISKTESVVTKKESKASGKTDDQSKTNGNTSKNKKKVDTPQKIAEAPQKKPKQPLVPAETSVKRKRTEMPAKKVHMTAEEYTTDNDNKRVFVTNLPDNVTDDEIKSLHADCQDFVLLSAYRKRKGSAILVFADEPTAERAKTALKGRKLRAKDLVVDYVGNKNSRKNPEELGPIIETRLYVGNLAEHCTEENLKAIFTNATVISVPSQRRHTFGFVEFADGTSAMEAIKKHNYSVFKGEKMIVQFARAKVGEKPKEKAKVPKKKVENEPKRAKVEEEEDSDEDDLDDGEDIGDLDSDEDGDDLDDEDDSEEGDESGDIEGGDDLESFDDEDED